METTTITGGTVKCAKRERLTGPLGAEREGG